MLKIIPILLIIVSSFNYSYANPLGIESSRLISTSGAGVGSILLLESSILNPASIAFFNKSGFYYQRWTEKLKESDSTDPKDKNKGFGDSIIITDTSSQVKGGFLYQDYRALDYKRRRFASSMASVVGKSTSMGIIYKYTKDTYYGSPSEDYHQGVFGITHIYSPSLSFGLVLHDPFKSKKGDSKGIFGVQYSVTSFIQIIGDISTDYHYSVEEHSTNHLAFQLKSFDYLFLRSGTYFDNHRKLKGNSYGASFIGPKLSIDFAYRKSEFFGKSSEKMSKGDSIEETSFSINLII